VSIMIKNLHLFDCTEIKLFLETNKDFSFEITEKKEKYDLIKEVWFGSKYWRLNRADKRTIIDYLMFLTGYKRSQMMALLKKAKEGRLIVGNYNRHSFANIYTSRDIALLAKTDELHECPNSKATQSVLKREYEKFGKPEYERLAKISSSHIYNLRKTHLYGFEYGGLNYTKTTAGTGANIGERSKPNPEGKPGFIRIDSVHQGDFEGEKGVYHINSVDEVTQWEIIGAVEKISEAYMIPLLQEMINQYPFTVIEFHADNGSEYINHQVARMLNKLIIRLTKSRPRRCNDNALVEGKNGAVIRKHMGRMHIPGHYAEMINGFYTEHFNYYLNYHRSCGYPTETIISEHGKTKRVYNSYMPPYEKLKSLDNAEQFLKEEISFEELNKRAYKMSDNEAAKEMQIAKDELFKIFKRKENI